jgi:hypothetical protein
MSEIIDPKRKVVFLNTDELVKNVPADLMKKMKNKNYIESAIVNMIVDDLILAKVPTD